MKSLRLARTLLRTSMLGVLAAATLVLAGPLAHAASITVNTTEDEINVDGDCSLREAVQAADTDLAVDACPAGDTVDTISLPAGTYSLATVATTLSLTSEIVLEGTDASTTFIEAAATPNTATFGVMRIESTADVTLRNLTVRHGVADFSGISGDPCGGGGIANYGTLLVEDARIIDSQTADTTEFESAAGGGICSTGPITLVRCIVEGNSTGTGSYMSGSGGGIEIRPGGILVASELTVTGNATGDGPSSAGAGGGLDLYEQATITDSSIVGNATGTALTAGSWHSGGYAGGLYVGEGPVVVERTLIANNTTGDASGSSSYGGLGGGIYNTNDLTLRNCTIAGNSTGSATGTDSWGGNGGGIVHQPDGPLVIHNCTFTGNSTGTGASRGGNGGGIQADPPDTGDEAFEVEIRSTIIAGNSVGTGGTGPDCEGALLSTDYNLIQDTSGYTLDGTAANDITGQDPQLGALADNGGPTQTCAITSSSPAFDIIPSGANGCGAEISLDQRGAIRPQDTACEIGAFEVGVVPVELQRFVVE